MKTLIIQSKLVTLEEQLARLVADIESEKDTRRRVNLDYETRLRNLEKTIFLWVAAVRQTNKT
jgi:hypothetical protein